MLFKPALNYFYLFFDRSYSEKAVFFYLDYKSKGTDGAPFSPLEPRRRSAKAKEMTLISQSNRKVFSSHWDSMTKNMERFACPQLPPIFPASTVLNAGIAGDIVETILYRVEVTALIIYLQILLLLFLPQLQKFYIYYDESVQLQISIYFQFYHNLITLKHTLLLLILLFIFRFKNFFQKFFFPRAAIHPI